MKLSMKFVAFDVCETLMLDAVFNVQKYLTLYSILVREV